jgi:hypothetical protein
VEKKTVSDDARTVGPVWSRSTVIGSSVSWTFGAIDASRCNGIDVGGVLGVSVHGGGLGARRVRRSSGKWRDSMSKAEGATG